MAQGQGLTDILIHEYFGVNLPIVWDIAQNRLGPLEMACRRLQESYPETTGPEA